MRKFDIYPKVQDDSFNIRTVSGGVVTIITFLFMIIVAIKEGSSFHRVEIKQHAVVQSQYIKESNEIEIFMDITVAYPCHMLQLNVIDASGNPQPNARQDISRQRLDVHFKPLEQLISDSDPKSVFQTCGNCLGANVSKCCLTCTDIANSFRQMEEFIPNLQNVEQCNRDKKAIEDKETCRIVAKLNTHFTKGKLTIMAGGIVPTPVNYKFDLSHFGDNVNLTHTIHTLRFGRDFEGLKNPLDNYTNNQLKKSQFMYNYKIDLVPTITNDVENQIPAHQYSASSSSKEITKMITKKHPGITFDFDTAPVAARFIVEKQSLSSFLTQLCAILGGGFTLGGFIDSFIFRVRAKKFE
ncbi:hypothetical protein TVAG_177510 [Trichomonas vaginalis G3]|uniref:Uncharacterized protein n=1 Tax=Trichomonas vaginalis (strain ATCC PRA-98 / G3) TaxID=412133 RepID=A2FMP3_TRIV3|nr:vesicle-mediated transport [Trichomonas vaginalis G3]EAX93843.1 hypothetical protein TVAG_177510 [Trichomonas vaginalis G3]KAI5490913.1 vesicle-mediated transport [Trichomonas vaginalis G3]|eukprot:XP_001306773.1 hypothetical protein [Trichomonas vaginalis G3]